MTEPDAVHWITVDEQIFSETVVLKAAYWLSGRYEVQLRRNPSLEVGISRLEGRWAPEEARQVEARLRRDLIDFRVRAVIDAETRSIRELLVAKAFAALEDVSTEPDARDGN